MRAGHPAQKAESGLTCKDGEWMQKLIGRGHTLRVARRSSSSAVSNLKPEPP